MSLLDLSSDLSRYRSTVRREENFPEASKATNEKNFATVQPITEKLSQFSIPIIRQKPVDHVAMMRNVSSTVKMVNDDVLINSVSEFSPKNSTRDLTNVNVTSIESVAKNLPKITKFSTDSKLNFSNTIINKATNGTFNLESPVVIDQTSSPIEHQSVVSPVGFVQTDNKILFTTAVTKVESTGVTIPDIPIIRTTVANLNQTVVINKERLPFGNIVDPNIGITAPSQTLDREKQSPVIDKNSIQQNLIVNPDVKIVRVSYNDIHLTAVSEFDLFGSPIQFQRDVLRTVDLPHSIVPNTYLPSNALTVDHSELNADTITSGLISGRFESSTRSKLSIVGTQEVDFFSNEFASGFVTRQQVGETNYTGQSAFTWVDTPTNADYFLNTNADGFTIRQQLLDTKYVNGSSVLGFTKPTGGDFFDVAKKYASSGFDTFTLHLETKYIPDASAYTFKKPSGVNYFDVLKFHSSRGFELFTRPLQTDYKHDSSLFTWIGTNPPAVNYFDAIGQNSTDGFHTFARMLDTKYILGSSRLDWDGSRKQAPSVNYFDVSNIYSTDGFHTFAQMLDTKYILGSSVFDWDGDREQAPAVNYFDLTGRNTTTGFHTFAQMLDTKYIHESSIFDWDGSREQAPAINYFDLTGRNTTVGFHTFAQMLDTKYVHESSIFDWDGQRLDAPSVNYFDLTGRNTTVGFHTFAQMLDTKYVHESSIFDWDGSREQAPSVNYFDLTGKNTTDGFHTFARMLDTKYVHESSEFDWDGSRQDAPTVNYFDLTGKHTTVGFHSFAELLDTKYVHESSEFDWDGSKYSSPEVNYFDLEGRYTSKGFHRLAQLYDSKYIPESSQFDWDGSRQAAPEVNFFTNANATGFTKFAQHFLTEYAHESSTLTFKGTLPSPVDYFGNQNAFGFENQIQLYDSKYVHDSSQFTFKGSSNSAPAVNMFSDQNAFGFNTFAEPLVTRYVHESSRFTFKGSSRVAPSVDFLPNDSARGFDTFSPLMLSRYVINSSALTWIGSRENAPEVNYFGINGAEKITGFNKLFNDKSQTKLSPAYSAFSFEGASRKTRKGGIPYTNFFGFTPSERTGFMVNMTMHDGTLYPIIDPTLRFDDEPDRRYDVESARSQRKRMSTRDVAKYAPNSLGKRPWSDGSLFATLENQVPESKINARAGSYQAKYEQTLKNSTDNLGYLTKWAITRRSPSPIDEQYNKFNLRTDSYNSDPIWSQPFVLRGIQSEGSVEPERWGGILGGFDEGVVRGGIVTRTERGIFDVQRIGKWLSSAKGLLWNAKQIGLQLMNPYVDSDPRNPASEVLGIQATRVFNPLSTIANVGSAVAGIHIARHGLLPTSDVFLNKYESTTLSRERSLNLSSPDYNSFDRVDIPTPMSRQGTQSRLLMLQKELLPESFSPIVKSNRNIPSTELGSVLSSVVGSSAASAIESYAKRLLGIDGIIRISSSHGGPQSYLGIGPTTIRRSTNRGIIYNTSPGELLRNPASMGATDEAFRRDVYFAPKKTYGEQDVNNLGEKDLRKLLYHLKDGPRIKNEVATTYDKTEIDIQDQTIDRIAKYNPFDLKYPSPADKFKKQTGVVSDARVADGPNPLIADVDDPIKQYRTSNYDSLKRNERRGNRYYNDFRGSITLDDKTKSFITNPDAARYDTRNLEERYGFGFQGDPGQQRDLPFISSVMHKKYDNKTAFNASGPKEFRDYAVAVEKEVAGKKTKFRGDRINIIDYKRANFNINTNLVYEKAPYTDGIKGTDDLIEFYFSSLVLSGHNNCPAEVIVFRSTFGNITDSHNPSWNAVKYMGRADPLYVYQGYEREISFDFTVHIGSRDEMKATWRKLNYLASWTAPEYLKSGQMRGPMIRLNIGHLYRKMPGYISTLSYTFDNTQTTWETAKLPEDMNLNNSETKALSNPGVLQLPKQINVSVGFVPVGVYRPEFRGVMYSLFDDTSGAGSTGIESGLIPTGKNKVNYFSEFDDLEGEPVIYSGYDLDGKTRTPYDEKPEQEVKYIT